jgi:hypothetical protein
VDPDLRKPSTGETSEYNMQVSPPVASNSMQTGGGNDGGGQGKRRETHLMPGIAWNIREI